MTKQKKKICLLLAGGTWTTTKNKEVLSVSKPADIEPWLSSMSELSILADTEVNLIAGEDQEIGPVVWEKLAKFIVSKHKNCDGFIIVTKPDRLVATTVALNFLLQNLSTTIIATASQMSGAYVQEKKELVNQLLTSQSGLGLRANLINAIQVAPEPMPAPAIMFGSRLVLGTKAKQERQKGLHLFTSVDGDYLAKVDFGITLKNDLRYSSKAPEIFSKINSNILVIEDIPNLDWSWSDKINKDYQAVLIKMSSDELESAKREQIKKLDVPVILYHPYYLNHHQEAIALTSCTWEVAMIKTMWAAANFTNKKDFTNKIKSNITGEFLNV
jgi:L-asparaginase